ncbi:MAG TPA: deoxyribonuclease IV [Candidatus Dormibacteraeota bacterium]|jgi:deoxyribonuclease-4|nr:deoxyribonuclease IV [Candidatus Dormibacteraeota bacterium]
MSPAGGAALGLHISTNRGFAAAVESARDLGVEAVQIFTGNPAAWKAPPVQPGPAREFTEALRAAGVRTVVSHCNYLINLASDDPVLHGKSKESLANEMERAAAYGLDCVIVHIGSHRGSGLEGGLERIVAAVEHALAAVPAAGSDPAGQDGPRTPRLLLENSAGTGDNIGGRFEDLGELLRRLTPHADRVGICFDTAHAHSAGNDMAGPAAARATIAHLDATVGLERVHVVHANDTEVELGGKVDRHWHIGQGNVGIETFAHLLAHPVLGRLPFILETPGDEHVEGRSNLETLRLLRPRA